MKGAKNEEKVIGPLFPRLHVNDTEKGGPRAPPRNKMALYEQFSVPSLKFSAGSTASVLPLPRSNSGSFLPSTSSNHGVDHERSVLSPVCNSPAPAHLAEKLHSYSSKGHILKTSMGTLEKKSTKSTNPQNLNPVVHLIPTVTCNSFQAHDLSSQYEHTTATSNSFQQHNFENSFMKELRDENSSRLPTIAPSVGTAPQFRRSQPSIDREKLPHPSSSMQLQAAGQSMSNQTEKKQKVSQMAQDAALFLLARDKRLSPLAIDEISEPIKQAHASLNQQSRISSVDDSSRLQGIDVQSCQGCVAVEENMGTRECALVDPIKSIGNGNASVVGDESYLRPSQGDDHRSPKVENGNAGYGCGPLRSGDAGRNNDISDTSLIDSTSGLFISPDDVVGVIGRKQFWKARRAIVNQQRVFALQVFELHRLIKVQRLIAGSPHLLPESNFFVGKRVLNIPPVKLPPECVLEQPPLIVKPNDDCQMPISRTECMPSKAVGKPPPLNSDTSKELATQQSNYVAHSGSQPQASMTADTKPASWCFHPPPGNQWLVPIVSPSEGFVYKPYMGSCPPTSGFMAPAYGSNGPASVNVGGDVFSTAFGVPASHHQGIGILPSTLLGQTYFRPYGMPVMNQPASGSAVEQVNPAFTAAGSNGQDNQLLVGDVNFTMPLQSSCNALSGQSGAVSSYVGKFHPSKDSELWGSMGSSPSESAQADALALFPMAPTPKAIDALTQTHSKQHTQVIKVVPHNPRSATESAARIFQSIQEERKQHD
ncbi:protein HEADING DATE 3B [Malania oleifera]|uniref:protein HEADING DATE 3B n=1 Tax=Malania oleifera TaxID=397392 RepID=UPI0025ADE823|nr:protein HEADING DATE 3B [Malania oleifera]XP_057976899.1 protein HEADING DATE 3B [Malania oleifera]XP_057976900.1 protein HEADING DATE 3B [Malania oleifera]XP_057976901.1 protein HEADING DATE 3B [Malania oleifera]